MSLVVAGIADDQISMVADTKIFFDRDEDRTRQLFLEALPKIIILRPNLAVGYAGSDAEKLIREIVGVRELPVDAVMEHLTTVQDGEFVVATLDDEPRLFQVADTIDDRTSIRRARAGDRAAYDLFRTSFGMWSGAVPLDFRLMASMQSLLTLGGAASVGGLLTRVGGNSTNGFSYVSDPAVVVTESFAVMPMVGVAPTIGALGYFLPSAGAGPLFPEHDPAAKIWLRASSAAEFVASAAREHGQHLAYTEWQASLGGDA